MLKIAAWLIREKGLRVFVEPSAYEEDVLRQCQDPEHGCLRDLVRPWYGAASDDDRSAALAVCTPNPLPRPASDHGPPERIDFVVSLGGDGTVLYGCLRRANWRQR
jgi:NAD kinase